MACRERRRERDTEDKRRHIVIDLCIYVQVFRDGKSRIEKEIGFMDIEREKERDRQTDREK